MPRQQRNTVEYFPHFAEQGKTLFILKSRFGNNGYAFWFQLLELLCKEENHVYECQDDEAWQYLLAQTGVDEVSGTEILQLLANLGKIDPELWKNQRIIWCPKLVHNLQFVYKKRGRPIPEKPITGTETPYSGTETPYSGTVIPQSKEKYSKVNNNIIPPRKKYGEFQNVILTDDEYRKLEERYNQDTYALIERLSAYIESTGKRYKSHYATILNWTQRDNKEAKRGKNRHSRDLPETYAPPPVYDD